MRLSLRRQVREAYHRRCGYCGVTEEEVGAELTIDHFHPQVLGGSEDLANLVYACFACNGFKGDFWSDDPIHRLLHPQNERVALHIREADDGTLEGLSETGTFHIECLHLNRSPLVAHRLERRRQDRLQERQDDLERRLTEAQARIAAIERRFGVGKSRSDGESGKEMDG